MLAFEGEVEAAELEERRTLAIAAGPVPAARPGARARWRPPLRLFHANSVGGPAMGKLDGGGALAGVIDYTLSELANSLMDGVHAAGPERLTVAGRAGLPQVIVPGCCDCFDRARATR